MNTYRNALEWLFSTQNRGVKLGLENVRRLLARFNDPQQHLRCAHVTGTNGKGSVCAMMASICREEGLRVGLFTSPHLVRFNERICINREPISDEAMVAGLNAIRSRIEPEYHPTFFEITTVLAFNYFWQQQCDFVVLEAGLGGRLDATNVILPVVATLTAIDLDHQKFLGQTKAEIAREKAGIIKPHTPVVSAPQAPEVEDVIREAAEMRSAPLLFVDRPWQDSPVGLTGSHQRLNAALAVSSLQAGELEISPPAVVRGLAEVRWLGRFQKIGSNLVLDGAHNPAAIKRLVQTWQEQFGSAKAGVVFAALRDKAIAEMLQTLEPIAAELALAPISSLRSASPAEIAALLPAGLTHQSYPSPMSAVRTLQLRHSLVLATGSLFLIGELLAEFDYGGSRFQPSLQ
jgi:dihydrofolate synthase/folylpolyglutamate synthase